MGFLCVTQSHTIDSPTVARNGSMYKCWKRWSGLKCILLAWKPPLKVAFCVIVVWAIPSDVKKFFFYCWVGISCEYSRCNNIDQQFADAILSKTAQIDLTLWLQEKIICMLNIKETCFEVFIWYKREFECFGNVFFSMTCKSHWSCDALLELKYAYINRSKNSEFK